MKQEECVCRLTNGTYLVGYLPEQESSVSSVKQPEILLVVAVGELRESLAFKIVGAANLLDLREVIDKLLTTFTKRALARHNGWITIPNDLRTRLQDMGYGKPPTPTKRAKKRK